MTNALLDENTQNSGMAVLNTDTKQGTNLVRIAINPSNRGMRTDTSATISFTMLPIDPRDENYRTCLTFTGSDGNLYPWVATSVGSVLVSI